MFFNSASISLLRVTSGLFTPLLYVAWILDSHSLRTLIFIRDLDIQNFPGSAVPRPRPLLISVLF